MLENLAWMNHLSNRDVAIVSEIAGTTRDVIETHLEGGWLSSNNI